MSAISDQFDIKIDRWIDTVATMVLSSSLPAAVHIQFPIKVNKAYFYRDIGGI